MRYCTDKELTKKNIEDQLFILDRDESVLHAFNPAGRFLWEQIINGVQSENLPELLCREFETDIQTAVRDCKEFIDNLQAKGLIRPERKQH